MIWIVNYLKEKLQTGHMTHRTDTEKIDCVFILHLYQDTSSRLSLVRVIRNSFKQFEVDSCLIFHDTFTFAISIYVIPYVNIVIDTPHSIIMQRKTKNINTDVFSVLLWSLKYNYKEQLCKLGEGRLLQPKRKSENYSKFQFFLYFGTVFFGFSILQPI